MSTYFRSIQNMFSSFEMWFNDHFGWFFTNGMKEQMGEERPIRA